MDFNNFKTEDLAWELIPYLRKNVPAKKVSDTVLIRDLCRVIENLSKEEVSPDERWWLLENFIEEKLIASENYTAVSECILTISILVSPLCDGYCWSDLVKIEKDDKKYSEDFVAGTILGLFLAIRAIETLNEKFRCLDKESLRFFARSTIPETIAINMEATRFKMKDSKKFGESNGSFFNDLSGAMKKALMVGGESNSPLPKYGPVCVLTAGLCDLYDPGNFFIGEPFFKNFFKALAGILYSCNTSTQIGILKAFVEKGVDSLEKQGQDVYTYYLANP